MSLKETLQSLFDETSDSILEDAFFDECITDGYYDTDEDEESVESIAKFLNDRAINFECVDQEGGEGEGDQYHTVYKFSKDDEIVFVKFHGWYASYHGSEMNGYNFVTPRKVEITVYA